LRISPHGCLAFKSKMAALETLAVSHIGLKVQPHGYLAFRAMKIIATLPEVSNTRTDTPIGVRNSRARNT
jgi:hypothetical protein